MYSQQPLVRAGRMKTVSIGLSFSASYVDAGGARRGARFRPQIVLALPEGTPDAVIKQWQGKLIARVAERFDHADLTERFGLSGLESILRRVVDESRAAVDGETQLVSVELRIDDTVALGWQAG